MNIWDQIIKINGAKGKGPNKQKRAKKPVRKSVQQLFPSSFIVGADEGGGSSSPHIVVFLNGARGRGEWYPHVAQSMANTFQGNQIVVREIHYPRVSGPNTLLAAMTGRLPVDANKIAEDIRAIQTEYAVSRVSIIAHSLGTFVVQKILQNTDVNFKNIILAGSIIDEEFPWRDYRSRYVAVINDCGQRDIIARLAGMTCYFGNSGRFGFHDPLVINRYHADADHSTFTSGTFDYALWTRIIVRGEVEYPLDARKIDGNIFTRCAFYFLNLLRLGCKKKLQPICRSLGP